MARKEGLFVSLRRAPAAGPPWVVWGGVRVGKRPRPGSSTGWVRGVLGSGGGPGRPSPVSGQRWGDLLLMARDASEQQSM